MNAKSFRSPRLAPVSFLILTLLLMFGQAAVAAPAVTAALSASSEPLTVGDPVHLVLTVQHPAGDQVVPPQLQQNWGEFSIKSVSPASTTTNPDGTATTTIQIDARLFKPGVVQTLPLVVKVADAGGNLTEATAAAVAVTVASVLKPGDTALRDIKGQATLRLPATWPWIAAGALAVLALAGTLFWYIRRRLARVVDNRLPHERALDDLNAIEALQLPQQGRFKEHYSLVSGCVRSYVERAFGVPALERTTGEIQADLAAAGIAPDVQTAMVAFLQDSDLIKFTTLTPDAASAAALLHQGRAIVQATAPQGAEPADGKPVARSGRRSQVQPTVHPAQTPEVAL